MTTVETRKLTAEEFFDLPDPGDGMKRELVRGEVVTVPGPGVEHGEIQLTLGSLIKVFLLSNKTGRVMTEGATVTERKPDTTRGPDISYYSKERLPLGKRVVKYNDEPPDLAVEVMSPSNSMRELKAKAKEYLFAGVRLVWIVDPEDRTVSVIADPLEARVLEADATLDGGDVLPGFACRVADLFA